MNVTRTTVLLLSCAVLTSLVTTLRAADKPVPARGDVSYGPHPHQLLDVYLPPRGEGPFPVLMWFGGLWAPSKGVPDLNRFFPAQVAVIGVQMRVMKDAIDDKVFPPVSVCLLDARRAIQYVRLHAREWNLDPERIVVGGGSQGALPALYLGCSGERADPQATDPVERMSTRVLGVGAWRSQPSIDPQRMQDWVPGVQWGAPAFGCSFADSLKKRDELRPLIEQWSPDALLNKEAAPIYFENNWGLAKPDSVQEMDYLVHSPRWCLGFQKLAEERGATCYVKYPEHPTTAYKDLWDFLILRAQAGKAQP